MFKKLICYFKGHDFIKFTNTRVTYYCTRCNKREIRLWQGIL